MKIEFYLDKTKTFKKVIYIKIDDQEWINFNGLTPIEIEKIFDTVSKNKKARNAFLHLSKYFKNKKELLYQFILCNWTKLDNVYDIANEKLNFENINCPFKGTNNCPFNGYGIVCINKGN